MYYNISLLYTRILYLLERGRKLFESSDSVDENTEFGVTRAFRIGFAVMVRSDHDGRRKSWVGQAL
jgi:hypothetical protein